MAQENWLIDCESILDGKVNECSDLVPSGTLGLSWPLEGCDTVSTPPVEDALLGSSDMDVDKSYSAKELEDLDLSKMFSFDQSVDALIPMPLSCKTPAITNAEKSRRRSLDSLLENVSLDLDFLNDIPPTEESRQNNLDLYEAFGNTDQDELSMDIKSSSDSKDMSQGEEKAIMEDLFKSPPFALLEEILKTSEIANDNEDMLKDLPEVNEKTLEFALLTPDEFEFFRKEEVSRLMGSTPGESDARFSSPLYLDDDLGGSLTHIEPSRFDMKVEGERKRGIIGCQLLPPNIAASFTVTTNKKDGTTVINIKTSRWNKQFCFKTEDIINKEAAKSINLNKCGIQMKTLTIVQKREIGQRQPTDGIIKKKKQVQEFCYEDPVLTVSDAASTSLMKDSLKKVGVNVNSVLAIKTSSGRLLKICPQSGCGRAFSENRYLKNHILDHAAIKPFKCDVDDCGKEFYSLHRLKYHKLTHKGGNSLCDICGFVASNIYNLKEHIKLHERAPVKCEQPHCQLTFPSKRMMLSHLTKEHTKAEGMHRCQICDRRFLYPAHLSRHQISHEAFACSYPGCSKVFAVLARLKDHQNSHTRPFICDIQGCQASFTKNSNLKRHQLKHQSSKGSQYSCAFLGCGKSYGRKDHLVAHHKKFNHGPGQNGSTLWNGFYLTEVNVNSTNEEVDRGITVASKQPELVTKGKVPIKQDLCLICGERTLETLYNAPMCKNCKDNAENKNKKLTRVLSVPILEGKAHATVREDDLMQAMMRDDQGVDSLTFDVSELIQGLVGPSDDVLLSGHDISESGLLGLT